VLLALVGSLVGAAPVSAADTGKLLPADTDVILTVNLHQFLADHRKTPVVRDSLELWRKLVTKDAPDLTQDVDRITLAFKVGEAGSLVVLAEGRFHEDRLRAAVKQLAQENAWSFQVARVGTVEVWQLPDAADGVYLALLDSQTLAVTRRQTGMDALLARRAGRKKDSLPEGAAGMQTLLAGVEREHVAVVVKPVDLFVDAAASLLRENAAGGRMKRSVVAGYALGQLVQALKQHAGESSTGIGLSFGDDELRLRFDLLTNNPKMARKIVAVIEEATFWTGLALKVADDELARQLADVLLKKRILVKDDLLTLEVRVPYAFIKQIMKGTGLAGLFPDEANAVPPSSTISRTVMEAAARQLRRIPIWQPLSPPPPGALAVESVCDLAYRTGPGTDYFQHRLDLFFPKGKKGYPVVVLVHGGGWTLGDNRCCGLYTSVGQFLASQGIGVVIPNYRLAPWVRHPEQVKDAARAVAWTREHIAEYGGDPRQLFLFGHSAGGHLVSLLATDESYLKAEGLTAADLKGVITASGVYHIPAGKVEIALGGTGPKAAGVDRMFPLRGSGSVSLDAVLPAFPAAIDIYGPAFGDDAKARLAASPLSHVRRGLPPFLILVAEKDWPTLAPMADEFHQALQREGCDARLLTMDKRNHNSLLFTAITPADPAARAILEFIRRKGSAARGSR
jgi:acetyl esterase/lipase